MANKTVTVKSSGGDYTSLNAALAGESADLVTNTCILTIECYAMQDTTLCSTGTGYTTSADYYIKVVVPTSERHNGTRSATKYRLEVSKGFGYVLTISEKYTRLTGLQIKNTHATSAGGISFSAGNTNTIIDSCLVYDSPGLGFNFAASNQLAVNCVAMSCETGFYQSSGTLTCYNCAAVNSTTYGFSVGGYDTIVAKNCYAGGSGTADYYVATNGTLTHTTSFSEDGSESVPTAAFATDSGCYFTNVTAGAENLNVTSASSSLYNTGTDLHADATWAFNVDIAGTARPDGAWDVGAFEYVAPSGAEYRPIFHNHYREMGMV